MRGRPWDRVLVGALGAAFLVRLLPIVTWWDKPCVRDECTYKDLARGILEGKGMVGTHGWLWAPAYPYLMAFHKYVFGSNVSLQISQLAFATLTVYLVYRLALQVADRRAARWAAWLIAVNPTHVYYTTSLWSETIYATLLLGAVLALGWAREGGAARGWLPGLLVGACVLFRGVATYLLPIFVLVLLWERWRGSDAWRGAVACVVAAALAVAPYSVWATNRFGGLVISDRTLGQMMWLGNNDFPPMTFDWGNGTLSGDDYDAQVAKGRDHCRHLLQPVKQDDCEVERGKAWIRQHPGEFLARVPLRVAQLLNPHSLLTRHLRWGKWRGLPGWVDEALIAGVVGFSFVTVWGGTVGWLARGRGWYALGSGLIVLYHVAAIAVLAGLTRYRLPLEPLWAVWAGVLLAEPRASFVALLQDRRRLLVAVPVLVALTVLMLWFLPVGWPSWRSWSS